MKKKIITIGIVFAMATGTLFGCGTKVAQYDYYMMKDYVYASDVAMELYEETEQYTEDDIEEMNEGLDGEYEIVYDEYGYVSSLVGRFYDEPVTSSDEVLYALVGIYDLLGIDSYTDYNLSSAIIDYSTNYIYYTYQQMWGGESLENSTLVVVTDEDHYVCALSNSFTPTGGEVPSTYSITARDAEDYVRNRFPGLYIYSDYTTQVTFSQDNSLYQAYAVYTDNPEPSQSFNMPYIEHFISYDGQYLFGSVTNTFSTDTTDIFRNQEYFEGLTETSYSATIMRGDGTYEDVTVPICYNDADGLYYMMDPKRYIAAADFHAFCYDDRVEFITSANNEDWDPNYVLAYEKYIQIWDFYDEVGVQSIDRSGIPLLLGMGYCTADYTPIDNAGYCGTYNGWGFFGISDINTASQALDVIGHEYTHGYSGHARQGDIYANEQGAINESLSDIMGNLIEMYLGATSDQTWLVGETGDYIVRCMSDPIQYDQPAYVGDAFYAPIVSHPNVANDNGGVHTNSSLLNSVAYKLHERGMTLEDEIILWLNVIEFLTPESDWEDVYVGLLLSAQAHQETQGFVSDITDIYNELGMLGDHREVAANAPLRNGYFALPVENVDIFSTVVLYDEYDRYCGTYYPDDNGHVDVKAPAGNYQITLCTYGNSGYSFKFYDDGNWLEQDTHHCYTFDANMTYGAISVY